MAFSCVQTMCMGGRGKCWHRLANFGPSIKHEQLGTEADFTGMGNLQFSTENSLVVVKYLQW